MSYTRLVTTVALAAVSLTACSSDLGGGSEKATTSTIKIGYVSPQTGPLAPFGEADTFVTKQMTQYFKDHPLKIGDKTYGVEIIVKDSQSDAKRAGEVASELINRD